jgi:hypothetical protein
MPGQKTITRLVILVLAAMLLTGVAVLASGAGTDSDPLVTKSYLDGPFKKTLLEEAADAAASQADSLAASLDKRIDSFTSILSDSSDSDASDEVVSDYTALTVAAGGTQSLPAGTELLFLEGTATISGTGLSDVTAGTAVSSGGALTANHLYVASSDCTLQAGTESRILMK